MLINTKKLAFICSSLDNMAGGLERQIIRTSKSLKDRKFDVILISYDNIDAKSFYKIPSNLIWIKCGNGLIPHKSASLLDRFKQILLLRRILKSHNITHLITYHHGLLPRSLLASIFLGIKQIVSERNSLTHYKFIKLRKFNIGFLSLFFARKITVQINSYKKQYPFFLRHKIYLVPNTIKKPIKEKNHKIPLTNTICMVGRLSEQKNFTPFLSQTLNKKSLPQNFKIKIAGEGNLRNQLEKDFEDLINSSYLELLGNIDSMDSFYNNSSLFCLPSLWEGYPNALAEALRIGLPIVTTYRFKDLNEFVSNNVNGLIVNDNELLDASLYLLENKKLLVEMSKMSLKKYKKLSKSNPIVSWENIID